MSSKPKAIARATKNSKQAPLALRAHEISKSFGATHALRSASIDLRVGEVHAIVGENGSGKSTLVKILAGVHRPDSGELELGDDTLTALASPAASVNAGIMTVFQEVLVVEARSVLENVWLGSDGLFATTATDEVKRQRVEELLEALMGTAPPLDMPVEHLSLSERQACCIARALIREPRVLLLDEATSALDVETRDRLFSLLKQRAESGCAVIFISHRMDEISEICDRITVMRSGETVATLAGRDATVDELVRLMTGSDALTGHVAERAEHKLGDVVLEADGFKVRAGELVGLAGLEGHGQEAFLRGLAVVAGDSAAYIPRERRAESLFESKSILENFGLPTYDRDLKQRLIRPRSTRERLDSYVDMLQIKLGKPEDAITTLSGGNQQKVVIARWLATDPAVLLLNDPTRGIDLGAKRDVYKLLLELAGKGVAIVMLSTEVDEHIELMDRVVVFREGAAFCEIDRDGLSRHALVSAFFGEAPKAGRRTKSNA